MKTLFSSMRKSAVHAMVLIVLTAAAVFLAQGNQAMTAKPKSAPGDTPEYSNPAEPIKIRAGGNFTLKMASNPTTGYGWELSRPLDEKVVRLVTNSFVPPASRLLGAGGHELWTFKTVGPGQARIILLYVRPWEKDKPAGTNVFIVEVE